MLKPKRLYNRGDTIIEVMIVLAILGLAIGISYATANRSLINARQAQENTQATEIIQSQAEAMRSLAANTSTDPDYIYRNTDFCIDAGGHVVSAPCALGESSRYNTTIHWNGSADDTFTIQASWADVAGQGTDTNTLVYRIHTPPSS